MYNYYYVISSARKKDLISLIKYVYTYNFKNYKKIIYNSTF